ncbi:MAG: alkaline phosphatase [Rectinemataceae bacterium]|nr:alkaline phosphatase [Spirochaetaceae bacterium]
MQHRAILRRVLAALMLLALAGSAFAAGTAKYVFFFVGDGLAMPQIMATEAFANALSSRDVSVKRLAFSQLPVTGLCTTYDAGSLITDSASAGTAFASGNKTLNGVINMDPGKTKTYKTIAEYAKEQGRKIGVISSVSIDHATPASMYAKSPSRGNYYEIAVQLTTSNFDYFGGGGFVQPTGKNKDKTSVYELAAARGYTIANTKAAIDNLKSGAGKVIAISPVLQDSSAMKYDIDREPGELGLADFVRKGVELLQNSPEGFFIFVEGGKIDWACHANDAASAIRDTLAFDEAVRVALSFAEKHPQETLVLVTGDHETGGMAIGFAGTHYETFFDKIAPQTMSYVAFNEKVINPYKASTPKDKAKLEDLAPAIRQAFGIDVNSLSQLQREQIERAFKRTMGNEVERSIKEEEYLLYGGYEPLTVKLTQILNQMAGIGWTSYSHTGVPVPVFAKGVGQEMFAGYYDNTDLFRKLVAIMNLRIQ